MQHTAVPGAVRRWVYAAGDRAGLLPPDAENTALAWADALEALLIERGVPLTPLILVRLEDLATAWLIARRLEDALWHRGVFCAAPPKRRQDTDDAAQAVSPLVEQSGKARERVRKAMKDLEEACEKLGTPIDQGLADAVRPLLRAADGVLADALAFEQAKQRDGSAPATNGTACAVTNGLAAHAARGADPA